MPEVTFATKCWERDWVKMLSGFKKKKDACNFDFAEDMLVINNVDDLESVQKYLSRVSKYLPDVKSLKSSVLSSFNLIGKDFKGSENYCLGELTAIYSCNTEYICFIQGDCLTLGGDWITPAIKVLESEPHTMIVSPNSDVNTWANTEGYDSYMSDQAFLARTEDLKNPTVYQLLEYDRDYPDYAQESFEALVGRYLKWSCKQRKILNDFYIQHPTYD